MNSALAHQLEHGPDEYLTCGQAARLLPNKPHPSGVWRWMRHGIKARTGERVHLRHARLGGKLFTTARWLTRFADQLAEADAAHWSEAEAEAQQTPAAGGVDEHRIAEAEDELDRAGVR